MKKLQKNKISLLLFIILLIGFIWVGTREYKTQEVDEHQIFSDEFKEVSKDNVFKYANASNVYNALNKGNALIFFGFNENEFTGKYASILNEAALENGISEILYYDFYEDRKNSNGTYESIVNYLKNYIYKDDLGQIHLAAPSFVIVKNKEILYYDEETAHVLSVLTPESYWTDYNVGLKKETLNAAFQNYLED